jgi:LDH2 family malate/lactate/ureidoglycolate dehydrogenase
MLIEAALQPSHNTKQPLCEWPRGRSYKGSHLALMVELLAGPLVGGAVVDKATSDNWGNLVGGHLHLCGTESYPCYEYML